MREAVRGALGVWLGMTLGVTACGPAYESIGAARSAPPRSVSGLRVECRTGDIDSDGDGLSDDCELRFAQAFAPALRVRSGGCNWDDTVSPARLGGAYLFGVEPRADDALRFAYLPAYFRDCGWSGVKCWLPFVNCDPHVGDSEFIVLDAGRADVDQGWRVDAIFLSAHCFGRSGSDCRWYRGDELARFAWVADASGHAPVIWVAEGRQANYPSRHSCDGGHSSIDTCDRHDTGYRFPVRSTRQNIGSAATPVGCATARELGSLSRLAVADAEECIWDDNDRFFGWQARTQGGGATPYARYLREIAQFGDGQ